MNNNIPVSISFTTNGFQDDNMYQKDITIIFNKGIRIVSLPYHLQTRENIKFFFEYSIGIGKVKSIKIVEINNTNVPYKTAYVEFDGLYKNPNTEKLLDVLYRIDINYTLPVYLDRLIYWGNGTHMKHISFRLFEPKTKPNTVHTNTENKTQEERLIIEGNDWSSIYVPVVPKNLYRTIEEDSNGTITLEELVEIYLRLGKISRVDYIERETEGFGSNIIQSAYIHFEYWYDNKGVAHFRNRMNTDKQVRITDFYDGTKMNKLFSYGPDKKTMIDRFIVFKVNHLPIDTNINTNLNIYQVFAMKAKLEEQMVEKENMLQSLLQKNDELMENNAELEKKLNEEKEFSRYLSDRLYQDIEKGIFVVDKKEENGVNGDPYTSYKWEYPMDKGRAEALDELEKKYKKE